MVDKNSLRSALASRDSELTGPFVREHYAWAVRRVRARGGAQDAEDIVQDVFRELFETPPKGLDTAEARAVLTVMISDRIIDAHRKRQKMPFQHLYSDLFAGVSNMSSAARRERIFAEVVGAMQRLQTMHRAMLELRYFDGLRPVEIAKQMSLTDSAVRGLLFRALDSLRDELGVVQGRG